MSKHVTFMLLCQGKKTSKWEVRAARGGAKLGQVSWYSRWRQYVFAPFFSTVYSRDCMDDISSFVKQCMDDRKHL